MFKQEAIPKEQKESMRMMFSQIENMNKRDRKNKKKNQTEILEFKTIITEMIIVLK